MERKIILGWGLTLVIAIFVLVYWLNEPHRMAVASEEFRLEAVRRGAELYADQCASCHGDEGQGIAN
ncbi:MAG: c-type cytochrome, partial [Anaerolineae bacterium]